MSRATTSARRVAFDALLRVEDGAFAHLVVPQMLRNRGLDARDRAFTTELVYGTVRARRTLDYLLTPVSARRLDDLDVPVRVALRLGAQQLVRGVPPHAAVAETVSLVPARARGFANGVLRELARRGPPFALPDGDDVESIGVRTSHPDWIVRLLIDAYGNDDAVATLELANVAPAVTLRVNPLRATPESVSVELRAAGAEVERGTLYDDALVVRHSGDLAALAAVAEGRATPQDQASQHVVAALDPQPGEVVLDVASAPGGKATAAAERMRARVCVIAADVHEGRVRTVARAAHRLRLGAAMRTVVADGRRLPVRDARVDRVLLDAPCSGLGVLRRRPDARWRVQPGDVHDLAVLQRELLRAAAHAVRPGGRLVYAVCTLSPEETTGVDTWTAEHLPGLHALAAPGAPWRAHGRGALLLPSDAGTDGMFVLALERAAAGSLTA